MSVPPYAQEFSDIHSTLKAGLPLEVTKEKTYWADVAADIAKLRERPTTPDAPATSNPAAPAPETLPGWARLNRNRRLWYYAKTYGFGEERKKNLAKAAAQSASKRAGDYVRPFALRACRHVLHALSSDLLFDVPGLWGNLNALGHPPRSDGEVLQFWRDSVLPPLREAKPESFSADAKDPWKEVIDCIDASAILAELIAKGQKKWSQWTSLKCIAQTIDCERKMRRVEPALKLIHSEIEKKSEKGPYRVRLDTMDEPYRHKFESASE